MIECAKSPAGYKGNTLADPYTTIQYHAPPATHSINVYVTPEKEKKGRLRLPHAEAIMIEEMQPTAKLSEGALLGFFYQQNHSHLDRFLATQCHFCHPLDHSAIILFTTITTMIHFKPRNLANTVSTMHCSVSHDTNIMIRAS